MTIYKAPITEKKPDSDTKALVIPPITATQPEQNEVNDNLVNIAVRRYERRPQKATNACIFLAVLIVLAMLVVGGVYLHRHFTHREVFRAFCEARYVDEQMSMMGDQPQQGFLREQVQLDTQVGYTRIEVPKFDECSSAVILHAFSVNLTAIVDNDNGRCFILPLDRKHITPPKDFWDMLVKMRTGYYVPSSRVIREHYQVVRPPIQDKMVLGPYIADDCALYDTYKLVKMRFRRRMGKHHHQHKHSHRYRRDNDAAAADDKKLITYGEFTGSLIEKIVIHNF